MEKIVARGYVKNEEETNNSTGGLGEVGEGLANFILKEHKQQRQLIASLGGREGYYEKVMGISYFH